MSNHTYSCPFWPDGPHGGGCVCDFLEQEKCPEQDIRKDDHLADVTTSLVPVIENPFPVYSATGKLLGSAVVTLAAGTFHVRFILDPQNPESFDLTNEPTRCRVDLDAIIAGGVFKGHITLTSK